LINDAKIIDGEWVRVEPSKPKSPSVSQRPTADDLRVADNIGALGEHVGKVGAMSRSPSRDKKFREAIAKLEERLTQAPDTVVSTPDRKQRRVNGKPARS
jgi:hypothetical protein